MQVSVESTSTLERRMTVQVPEERVKIMRQAFADVMKDPGFIADMDKAKLQVNPLPGEKLQILVADMVDLSDEQRPVLKKLFNY